MNPLKIIFLTIQTTVTLLIIFSFIGKSYKSNAFSVECWQYLGPNFPTEADIKNFSSPTSTSDNWQPMSPDPLPCNDIPYLCAICFENSQPLTAATAIAALGDVVRNDFQSIVTVLGQEITVPGTSKKFRVYLQVER